MEPLDAEITDPCIVIALHDEPRVVQRAIAERAAILADLLFVVCQGLITGRGMRDPLAEKAGVEVLGATLDVFDRRNRLGRRTIPSLYRNDVPFFAAVK